MNFDVDFAFESFFAETDYQDAIRATYRDASLAGRTCGEWTLESHRYVTMPDWRRGSSYRPSVLKLEEGVEVERGVLSFCLLPSNGTNYQGSIVDIGAISFFGTNLHY